MFISRTNLISIINEDLALDAPTSPRKRSKFVTDANDPNATDNKKRASKGGQSKAGVSAGTLIFRRPTKAELIAAGESANVNLSSDSQMQQIRILSKVLFDFGLLDKIYKSKKDDWNLGKTNAAETDKMLKNIERIFNSKNYSPETPTEVLAEDLENSTTRLEEEIGVRIPEVIGAFKNWREIMVLDPKTKSPEFPKGFNPRLMANIEAVAGVDYKEVYKKLNEHLINVMTSNKFDSPAKYAKYVAKNETIRAVLNEPIIKKLVDSALSSNNIKDIEEFVLYLKSNLTKNRVERKMGDTMTIIHNKAMERIRYFDLMMKRKGYEDGIRNFGEMVNFLEKYDKNTLDHVCRTYNLTPEKLKSFNSYSEFCNWLFGDPERLYSIIENLGTRERARTTGDVRKGMNMAVLHRDLLKKEEKLRNQLSTRGPRAKSREDLQKEIEELQKAYEELTEDLKARKEEKGTEEYNKIKKLRVDVGRKISAKKHALKKRPENEHQRPSIEDNIEKYRAEREALVQQEADRLSDNEFDSFRDAYDIDKKRFEMGDYDIGTGYVTMAFSLKLNPNEHEVVDYIVNTVDKYLNGKEIESGKEDLINVDYEPGKYEGTMRMYPCTRIVIDYPKSSTLYKRIKSIEDKSKRSMVVGEVINKVQTAVRERYGKNLELVLKDPKHKINIMKKQDASYSFRD